jgi:FixJ family two-component response regulator
MNASESRGRLSGDRIVSLVDDDVAFLDALADLIESAGYQTYKFGGASEFLNSGAAQFSHALITDIQMSGIDGLTLMDLVADIARLPVIVITGQPEDELRLRATSKGCAAFLRKPFDPVSLLCHLEAAIRQG